MGNTVANLSYHKNIVVNYFFTLFCNLDLTRGLWMIYLASRGFTLLQLGVLEGVFHITSFLMEVPTGAVADLWGRKISRLVGRVFFLASLILMFYARNFSFQLLGFIVCAVGYNLESGAGEALIYDSLLLDGRKDDYMRVTGRKELVYQSAAVAAYLVGGYLAVRSYPLVFHISMGIALASLVSGFFFIEPQIEKTAVTSDKEGGTQGLSFGKKIRTSMKNQTVESLKVIRRRPRIAFLIIFSELIFTIMVSLFFYLQNFWKSEGKDEFYIGVVFAVGSLVSGLISLRAPAIEKKIGEHGVLISMPLLLLVCLWGIALTPWQAPFYVMMGIIEGILIVAISDYINRLIPSQNRATILSFQSMTFSLFMIILFPVIGWVGDTLSLKTAFLWMAVFVSILSALYVILVRSILVSPNVNEEAGADQR
ncbi:MAG: MFS transporter [Bacteroidetes bacterium]|nr:MFS transporter [Bacteroidota bacterium]